MPCVQATDDILRPKRTATVRVRPLVALALVSLAQATLAEEGNWFETATDRVTTLYREGNTELYVPFHAHHMRFAYSNEKINGFQEHPPGLGIGRGLYDRDGALHSIYAMGFQDSHFRPQWMAGYGYRTFWHPESDWKLGVGLTAFLMARSDVRRYMPFPGILPVASVSYRNLAVEAAFVPGGNGFGNILFFWAKYQLGQRGAL